MLSTPTSPEWMRYGVNELNQLLRWIKVERKEMEMNTEMKTEMQSGIARNRLISQVLIDLRPESDPHSL